MEFKDEREAEFWERALLAVIVAPKPLTAGGSAVVEKVADNLLAHYRDRRAKLDAPGAPYRDAK